MEAITEKLSYKALWKIRRFASEEDKRDGRIYSKAEALRLFGAEQFSEFVQNLLLNEGINELWTILCSAGGTKFDNTNAYLGVGDSDTAAQATDTGLLGSSKTYKAMDGSYPTYGTSQKATWRSTFGSADGNHAWKEFTVCNTNLDTGKNLNRKVSDQGSKQSGQSWELTLEITLS
jgi:hypothetical protein